MIPIIISGKPLSPEAKEIIIEFLKLCGIWIGTHELIGGIINYHEQIKRETKKN